MDLLNVILQFLSACFALYLVFALLGRHREEREAEEAAARAVLEAQRSRRTPRR